MAAGPHLFSFRWPDCSGCTVGPSTESRLEVSCRSSSFVTDSTDAQTTLWKEEHVGLPCGAGPGAGCSRFHVQGGDRDTTGHAHDSRSASAGVEAVFGASTAV